MDYSIRPARPDDLPHLPEIEHAAAQLFRHTEHSALADDTGPDLDDCKRWWHTGAIWVAVDSADNIVGFAVAKELDGQGFLSELDVHPAHGRRGLGRRLIEAVRAWAVQREYTELRLSTFARIEWNAPYYARLGFCTLAEAELGPELLNVRQREAASGLDVTQRVFMTLAIGN